MSLALYDIGGLRFWTEKEIEVREFAIKRLSTSVRTTLLDLNQAWRFARVEGPCLSPRGQISASYDDSDIFITNHVVAGDALCLRAETTPSSYAYARKLGGRMPLCVWQAAKSFRRETNDGASAAKLRFNEFYQLEFQCIYKADSKADYRAALIAAVRQDLEWLLGVQSRVVDSDRLPSYSESTIDIEVPHGDNWREIASCSIRTDYADDMRVAEIAIGLDRIVSLSPGSV